MVMALENILLRIGKQKFSALQKIIPEVGNKFKEQLMMVHQNSTNLEIYAYNLDMTECLVYRVLIYFDLSSFLVFEQCEKGKWCVPEIQD